MIPRIMLYGSSVLPSMIRIGDVDVQLGDVVRRAYGDSGMTSAEAWNDGNPLLREFRLIKAIYDMRAEAEKS